MAEQAETSVPSEQPAQIEVNSETATPKEDSQEPKTAPAEPAAAEAAAAVEEPPKPKPASPGTVKACFIQRQGLLWKKWNRQYMILEEGGACLRFFKSEARNGADGALFMRYCADVTEPKEGTTTNWPAGTEGRCFVICSPKRAHYIVAETAEDKNDWVEKLLAAKQQFNTEGHTVIGTTLFSMEAFKHSVDSSVKHLSAEVEKAKGGSAEPAAAQTTPTEGEAATPPATEPAQAPPTKEEAATPPASDPTPQTEEEKPVEKQEEPATEEPKEAEPPAPEVAKQQPEVAEQQPEVAEQQPEEQPKEEETKAED